MFETFGKVPKKGEEFTRDGLSFKVIKVKDRRIHSVIVNALEIKDEDDE